MNDFISNIYYFGSPKDGFKVYPDLGAKSNVFAGYYTNTETDWILIAKKSGNITRYIYVKYGLLTAVNGRTGSCLGISIDFVNCYFTDLKIFHTEVIEKIWDVFLKGKILLEIQETSGKVAFKSYDLLDVSSYLDDMSKKIREVIADKKYSNYIRPSYEIADAGNNPIHGLHPDSSPLAINEYFRTHGIIKLSPKLPIETKSSAEKAEDEKKRLERTVVELNEQLEKKAKEISSLNAENNRLMTALQRLQDSISAEFADIFPENMSKPISAQITNSQWAGQKNILFPTPQQIYNKSSDENASKSKSKLDLQSPIIFMISIVITFFILGWIIIFYLLPSFTDFFSTSKIDKTVVNVGKNVNSSENQRNTNIDRTIPSTDNEDILYLKSDNTKTKAFLTESVFLTKNAGKVISNMDEFKETLTTYLLKNSSITSEIYKDDKNAIWANILLLNPNSVTKITTFISKKEQVFIENNAEQREILKDFIIYTKDK